MYKKKMADAPASLEEYERWIAEAMREIDAS